MTAVAAPERAGAGRVPWVPLVVSVVGGVWSALVAALHVATITLLLADPDAFDAGPGVESIVPSGTVLLLTLALAATSLVVALALPVAVVVLGLRHRVRSCWACAVASLVLAGYLALRIL